jgi:tetratricopeptide (TPR) repeat protein
LGTVPSLSDGCSARAETAADLAAALVAGAAVALVPVRVAGERPGGWLESCGKTQLAACIADSMWRSRLVDLLLWVDATSRASVLSGYVEAAHAVGACRGGDGELVAARFIGWLRQTSRPWLLVFDDVADPGTLEGLWPHGQVGRVLATTASPAAFTSEYGALIHRVGVYSREQALSYLMRRLTGDPGKHTGAAELVHDLGHEPLALAQASAVIASSALSCRDYRDVFAGRRDKAAAEGGAEPAAASITWAMSAEHAGQLAPGGAGALLSLAALLDGHGIPRAVFLTAAAARFAGGARHQAGGEADTPAEPDAPAERERVRDALLALERAGLLAADAGPPLAVVRMNAAVQAAVRAATPQEAMPAAAAAAADALLETWPYDDEPAWLAGMLRSGTASLQRTAGDLLWAGGCHPLLVRAGRSLDRVPLRGPAIAYWHNLASVSDRILGPGHPDTLAVREQLARACLAAGRAEEAAAALQLVLTERVRVLGPDHPSAIVARRDLGRALVAAAHYDEAVTALERAAADDQRVHGADQPETLSTQDELAAAYHAAGRFGDAAQLYRRTLASRERSQGPENPDTLITRQRLAGACLAAGKVKHALAEYKRVLDDSEHVRGPDHLETIAIRAALAAAYHSTGRMALALQLYEQTHASYRRAVGADHYDTLTSSANLAHVYYTVGRVTDALTVLRDTLARGERALPAGDPLTEAVRESLTSMAGGTGVR